MTKKATVVEILDEARNTGDYDRLMRLLYAFLRGDVHSKDEIIQEALIEIAIKLRSGEPSFLLAPKLRGFLNVCTRRLRSLQERAESRLGDTGDEVYDVVAPETSDPAVVLVRLEDMDEKIALLRKLRDSHSRYFEALVADAQDVPIPEHFRAKFGEAITPENSRKIRERAKQQLSTSLKALRKDSST